MNAKRLYHSACKTAYLGKSLQIAVSVRESVAVEDLKLNVTLGVEAVTYDMVAKGSINLGSETYRVFGAIIPAGFVSELSTLSYTVELNGEAVTGNQLDVKALPDIPELYISELALRPKGTGCSAYIELTNTTAHPVDLFAYKVLFYDGHEITPDTKICANYFTHTEGEIIVPPYATVAVRFLTPATKKPENAAYAGKSGFCDACNLDYEYTIGYTPIDGENLILIDSEICVPLEDGRWKLDKGCFDNPHGIRRHTLSLVPRNCSAEDAIYSVYINGDSQERDLRVKKSTVCAIDLETPSKSKILYHALPPTPGYLDTMQAIPDFSDILPPVIIPDTDTREANYSDGDLTLTYAVIDKDVTETGIFYLDTQGGPIKLPAERTNGNNIFTVTVPGSVLQQNPVLSYFYFADDTVRTAYLGSPSEPFTARLNDDAGPELISILPTEKFCFEPEADGRVEIKGRYYDISGISIDDCSLLVDGVNLSQRAEWSQEGFSCRINAPSTGDHIFELVLSDTLGNTTQFSCTFSVSDGNNLNHYHGEFHSHTLMSDGVANINQAMEYARDVGGVDFFAITDHSHVFAPNDYAWQLPIADSYNDPGKFATLYGWEMTWSSEDGSWGHMNVLNTKWAERDPIGCSVPDLYRKVVQDPDAITMFNHPDGKYGNAGDFDYIADDIRRQMCLIEIPNPTFINEYMHALSLGWKVSPAANGDNHFYNWTTSRPITTYILAPALTRENIIDSMRKRRTYATSDPSLKLTYKVNGKWLGSTLRNPESLSFEIRVLTENPAGIGRVSIVAENGIVVASMDAGLKTQLSWTPSLSPDFKYYYVKILNGDTHTVSAPIWIERPDAVEITRLELGSSPDPLKPHTAHIRVKNTSEYPLSGTRVDLYVTDTDGFDLNTTAPYLTAYVSKIDAGRSCDLALSFPTAIDKRRVSIIVKGIVNGKYMAGATAFAVVSPVIITSVLPASSPYKTVDGTVIKEPFPYLTLYNTTCNELDLGSFTISMRHATGVSPKEANVLTLSGIKLKPHSTIVIWQTAGAAANLTVKDFNTRYSCDLTENESIVKARKLLMLNTVKQGVCISLTENGRILSRVRYNFGLDIVNAHLKPDAEIQYAFAASRRGISCRLSSAFGITPGTVSDAQKPLVNSEPSRISPPGPVRAEYLVRAASLRKKAAKRASTKKTLRDSALGNVVASLGKRKLPDFSSVTVRRRPIRKPRGKDNG